MQQGQSSQATGTRNETYNIISVLYHALQGAENCQIYLKDAEGDEIRSFLEEALDQQRQLAERGKQVLSQHLQSEGGQSGSAFGFSQSESSGSAGGSPSQTEPSFSGGGSSGGQSF